MIDKPTFVAEMTILRDRFGRRDMTPETVARYLDFLGPRLTTAQFTQAAREIFNRDTFWPAPARFLEALQGGNAKELAEAAWTDMLRFARDGKYPPLDSLDDATRAGLKAAPMREIQVADDVKINRLKREFVAAHAAAQAPLNPGDTPALPAARAELTP